MNNVMQFLQSMSQNNQVMQNPTLRNGIQMGMKGDFSGIEKLVRNTCHSRGIDPDEYISNLFNKRK